LEGQIRGRSTRRGKTDLPFRGHRETEGKERKGGTGKATFIPLGFLEFKGIPLKENTLGKKPE